MRQKTRLLNQIRVTLKEYYLGLEVFSDLESKTALDFLNISDSQALSELSEGSGIVLPSESIIWGRIAAKSFGRSFVSRN